MEGRLENLWRPVARQRAAHDLWRHAVFKGIFLPLLAALLLQRLRLLANAGRIDNQGMVEANSSIIVRPGEDAPGNFTARFLGNRPLEASSEPFRVVELQEDKRPWHVLRVLVPLSQEVAAWWNSTEDFMIRVFPCQPPSEGNDSHTECMHLEVKAAKPFHYQGRSVQAIQTEIFLPRGTIVKDCRFAWVQIGASLPEMDATLRALHLTCPVTSDNSERGGVPGLLALVFFAWLLLPWPLLLLPTTIMYTAAQPVAFASALCLANLTRYLRRRKRLWKLSSLGRRKVPVDAAYGEGEPCCICFGAEDEANICLLPCRHSLHASCYRSWICTDSYPSRDLICPICRRKVTGVGKLV